MPLSLDGAPGANVDICGGVRRHAAAPLGSGYPPIHERSDSQAELVEVHRLPQDCMNAGTLRVHVLLVKSGKRDGRNGPSTGMCPDALDEFHTVHARHREVGHNDVDLRLRLDIGQGAQSPTRLENVRAARAKKLAQHAQRVVVVLDGENDEAGEVR